MIKKETWSVGVIFFVASTAGTGLAAPLGPTLVGGRASCQTVQTPVCGDPSMCNAASQQCCNTVNQQVSFKVH